ncbi:HMA2 domain-containing protein [Nostoc sp. CCY0012]|uniref:HMA2 domain-containing protein n=1 Tax=Nostoc sp. CCY0012 TaxID=1056123 RepID=UPI0039C761A1
MLTNNHGNPTKIAKIIEQASLNKLSRPISTKIISETPGRLRLRIARPYRHDREMQRITNVLKAQPEISQVRTNINYGSIIINHDGDDETLEKVLTTLLDLGVNFVDITEGKSEAVTSITSAFADFNQQFEQATNGEVDLRLLFPLGLTMLSMRQIWVKGLQLEIIPWYVLAWYAFDSFMKLNSTNQVQNSTYTQEN